MTYPVNGSIPGPNDLLSQSQSQIQTNFNNIVGWSAVDHIEYGATNAGTHAQVTIVTPVSAPSPASTTGIITTQTANSKSELFYTNATENVQITNTSLVASNGSASFPGLLQVRSGTGNSTGVGTNNTFDTPFETACVSVVVTSKNASPANNKISVTAITKTNFTAQSVLPDSFYYIALGY